MTERYRQTTGRPGTGFTCTARDGTHIRWTADPYRVDLRKRSSGSESI
jgi:hypothetical protein